ncbi:MAG: hypothetical protein QM674_20155 [Burkholderiaceae bacterium]
MGLKPGDKMAFALLSDGTLVLRPKTRRVASLVGLLRRPGQPIEPKHCAATRWSRMPTWR